MMTSADLESTLKAARVLLAGDPEWSMFNSVPAPASERQLQKFDGPADYASLLCLADGLICGRIVLYKADVAPTMQFYADTPADEPVQLGQDRWYVVGKVYENPILMRRDDGTIWAFPDTGVPWNHSDRFEKVSEGIQQFVADVIFGDGYLEFCKATPDDQWWSLSRTLVRERDGH